MPLLLFTLMFLISTLHAVTNDPIILEITSPHTSEGDPSGLNFVSALVTNQFSTPFIGRLKITCPEGWQSYPCEWIDLSLGPEEKKVLVYGLKVPQKTMAGEHPVTLSLEGFPDFQQTVIIVINPTTEVVGTVNGMFDTFNLNQRVPFSISYTNHGNIPLKVGLETKSEPYCNVECISETFEIQPYETIEVPIVVAPDTCYSDYSQYLLVKLINVETGEQLVQNPMTLKFVKPGSQINDAYVRIPAYAKAMIMGDRYKTIFAAEFAGGGMIDPERERVIDFFFRLPTCTSHIIYNIDEVLYAGMEDRDWNIQAGDTVYSLSPLTQLYQCARGIELDHKWEKWEAGIHYDENNYSCSLDRHEIGSYVQYQFCDNVSFSTNFLHKVEKGIPTSNILTLQTIVDFSENVTSELELGKNFIPKKRHHDNLAYRFETHGRVFNDTLFYFEKTYAGREFFGYYNNIHLLSTSLDFPICNRFRLNVNASRFTQNLIECCDNDYPVIPRQHQCTANLFYFFTPGCTLSFNGMYLRAKDIAITSQYDFCQGWIGSSLFCSYQNYILNLTASWGKQKDYLKHKTSNVLQRYYAYLSKEFSPRLRGSIYYDSGNINYYDAHVWKSGYGCSTTYRFASTGYIEGFLQKVQHTCDGIDLLQISANANYTFKNLHKIQAEVQHYHYYAHYPNDTIFIISYSIPLNVPVCKRKDLIHLSGVIYNSWENTPVADVLIACGPSQVTTGSDGYFDFKCIPAGKAYPKITRLPGDLITLDIGESEVHVPGGSEAQITIPVVPACSIRGVVELYAYKDTIRMLADPSFAEIVPQNGLKEVLVAISRDEEKEIYSCMTNKFGEFYFPKLRPGKWTIKVFEEGIPSLHYLENNQLIFDINPSEEKVVEFHVYPETPQIFKLES